MLVITCMLSVTSTQVEMKEQHVHRQVLTATMSFENLNHVMLINGVSNRWTGIQTGIVEWIIGWNFFVLQQMAPFSMYSSYSFFHPYPLCQTSGGGMDASQYKAELTIGRLVIKESLSRVWNCSETMFLKDSIVHFVVHSTVPAVSCSMIRQPFFQCLSIKLTSLIFHI